MILGMKCKFIAEINMNICLLNSRNTNASSHTLQEPIQQNTNGNNQYLEASELLSII